MPDDRAFTFTYDESDVTNGTGRLTRIKSASGDEWRFGYDAMGRISLKTYTLAGLGGRARERLGPCA
jgi:YD repeat-containing protein